MAGRTAVGKDGRLPVTSEQEATMANENHAGEQRAEQSGRAFNGGSRPTVEPQRARRREPGSPWQRSPVAETGGASPSAALLVG